MFKQTLSPNTIPITQEEETIRELVDEIYEAESKIAEITANQNQIKSQNTKQNPKVSENILKIKELQSNIENLKNICSNNCFQINSQIKDKQLFISDLNSEISQLKNALTQYNPISFKCLLLSKYILSNSNIDFLTNEQIEDIITNVNMPNEKITELKRIKIELQSNENTKENIQVQLEDTKMKHIQYDNIFKMLKEEKLTIKEELINLISEKESFEEILKMNISNVSLKDEGIKKFSLVKQASIKEIELFPYEIMNIDLNKASNYITDNIIEIFEISNLANVNNNNNKFNNNTNISNIEFDPLQNQEMDNNTSRSMGTLINLGFTNNMTNNMNIISIPQFKIDKDSLNKVIFNEIDDFQKKLKQANDYNLYHSKPTQQFLTSLSNIIINTIFPTEASTSQDDLCLYGNNLPINISSNTLSSFLLYSFKVLQYDHLIEMKIAFISKEYKTIKKELNKQLDQNNLNLNKLTTKCEDIESKISELQNREKIYQDEYNKYKSSSTLSDNGLNISEKSYIEICSKGKILLKRKSEIENEIKELENEIQKEKNSKDNEINDLQTNMNKLNEFNKQIQNEIEFQQLKDNEQIIQLRKIIADKFNLIKIQLQIYKNKHGSNLEIYNKLIDSINTTIQSTCNKNTLLNSQSINHNPNPITYNHGLPNTTKNVYYENRIFNTNKKKLRNKSSSDITSGTKYSKNNNNINTRKLKIENNEVPSYKNETSKTKRDYSNNIKRIIIKKTPQTTKSTKNIIIKKPKVYNNRNKSQEEISIQSNSIASANLASKKTITLHSENLNRIQNIDDNDNNHIDDNVLIPEQSLRNTIPIGNITKSYDLSHFPKGSTPKSKSVKNENKQNKNNDDNWLEEREQLAKRIQNLKETISQLNNKPAISKITSSKNDNPSENLSNNINKHVSQPNTFFSPDKDRINPNIPSKITSLTQITFCYYRLFTNKTQKYNPLSSIPITQITNPPFNFIKGTICLNKNHKTIHISPSTALTLPIELKVEDINNTIVNSTIKKVIEIHREYRKDKCNKLFNIEQFAEKEMFKDMKMNKDDIIKAALNKNFNFSILVNNIKRYEFILNNYDDFKMWINGVACLLKNNQK